MKTALTIGNFDGVHLGHKRLIHRVLDFAREHDLTPALLTFDPHPTRVVAPDRAPCLLTNLDQRKKLLHAEGIEYIEVLPFTSETAKLTPREFIEQVVVGKLRARAVVVGHNFRFGNKAAGNVEMLREFGREFGFDTAVVEPLAWRGVIISSSEIRGRIQAGDVSRACRMLGRPYALEGEVVRGHGVGSKKTVPTLNLSTTAECLPAVGVYITRTHDAAIPEDHRGARTRACSVHTHVNADPAGRRQWQSVTNVGYRPTFGSDDHLTIETFLLEPLDGDTPATISVEFLKHLREERKFENPEALKAQILRDVGRALKFYRRLSAFMSG
jgi:riboflavin kinase / FMN adenylyltransferase